MNIQTYMINAESDGRAIQKIYSALRQTHHMGSRTELLEKANQHAQSLSEALVSIASTPSPAGINGPETTEQLRNLGLMMEQIMIMEREFRISAGGEEPCELKPAGSGGIS